MSYKKNTSGQKFNVLAVNTATGLPVTGDAANITAKISIDSAAFASVSDTNPTELDATNAPGVYVFDLTQAETNGDVLTIIPSSTTANVQLDMLNIYTTSITGTDVIADAVWDEVLTGVTHNISTSAGKRLRQLSEVGVYEGGQVWIDTVNGAAGTNDYENGTVDNPSSNIADATTLANSVGITRFKIAPNSSFTLASAYTGFSFFGDGRFDLNLGGQQLNKTSITHAIVSGTCTTTDEPHFEDCDINTVTLPGCEILRSRFNGTITLSDASTYSFDHCFSGVAGTSSPVINFGLLIGNTSVNMRHYSGGIEVQNMGQTGTDIMSLEGNGQLIINANCTGGSISLRGNFKITDNSGGAVTIIKDDNSANIVSIKTITDALPDSGALTSIATAAALTTVDTVVDGIKAVTDNLPDSGSLTSIATASALTTVDTVVDAILVDTGTTIPAQITALNDLDAAGVRSAVGLASANLDTQLGDIPTVSEFEARTLVASAYFDPAADTVANVTLVGTCTTNTDMRGTDNALLASSAPTNFGDLAITASTGKVTVGTNDDKTGYTLVATPPTSAEIYTYFTDGTREDLFKADVSALATSASIAALNNFDPANDIVANVTLVDTTTTNTDMRGTDGANTIAPANSDIAAIKSKTDQFVFTTANQVDANCLTGGLSQTEVAQAVWNADISTYQSNDTFGNAYRELDGGTTRADVYRIDSLSMAAEGLGRVWSTYDHDIDIAGSTPTSVTFNDPSIINRDEFYTGMTVLITQGQGQGQARLITAYDGTTKTATIYPAWSQQPGGGLSDCTILGGGQIIDVSALATSASISALNDFDPANDTVAHVTLVDTTTTNTDMRGTDSAATASSLAIVDGRTSAILTDTGTDIPAQISALNDFDPSSDTVARVTLVDTVTTNTDMRGTDGANTTTPPSVSDIVSGISAENYDGVAFDEIMKIILSMAQGKIVESSSGVFDFYAQDNTTVLYTLTKAGSQRNRS